MAIELTGPAATKRMLPVVTNSELKEHRACPRAWRYRYGMLRRSRTDREALRFGTLFHAGLEAWWRAEDWRSILDEVDPFEAAKVEALLTGYCARWEGQPYEVLGVEVEFRAPLVNPETGAASKTFELGGKLDALIRIHEGPHEGVWIVEHKTSSEDIGPGSPYWRRLRLDSQISTYMVGARALGHEPRGVLYDVIGKPGLIPLKATPLDKRKYTKPTKADPVSRLYAGQRESDETPDEYLDRILADIAKDPNAYYQRGFVVRSEDEEREAAHDAWTTAGLMRDAKRLAVYPRNPDACVRYGATCAYFDVCTGVASIHDETRYRSAERAHEELSE